MADDKKETIKAKLAATRADFLSTVGDLTDEQWGALAFSEGSEWRVIDLMRHVTDSERGMLALMMQIKDGGEGVSADFDLTRWNQRVVTKMGDKGPSELMDSMVQNRAALESFIDGLAEADWPKKGRHASQRIMTIEEICHLIADHEALHLAGIREAVS